MRKEQVLKDFLSKERTSVWKPNLDKHIQQVCLFCCFFHFYTISVIIRCQELPDEVVQSKPHLSEVFTLANNKLQGQQGLPVEAQMEGVSCSESLGSCIF